MALGASSGSVLRMALQREMLLVLTGISLGTAAAFAATRVMAGLLYGTNPTDFITFAGVAAMFAMIAAIACVLPARRATSFDPLVAFRSA